MKPEDEMYLSKPAFETNSRDLILRTVSMLVMADVDFTYSSRCDEANHWTYRIEVAHRYEMNLKGIIEVLA